MVTAKPSRWLVPAALILGAILPTSCKRHDASSAVQLAPELNLPNISAAQQKTNELRLAWNLETTVGTYNKSGTHNRKWDSSAREALTLFAEVRTYGPDVKGFPWRLSYLASDAYKQGCRDPMIQYLCARYVIDADAKEEAAKTWEATTSALEASPYHALRIFYGEAGAKAAYENPKPVQPRWGDHIKYAHDYFLQALSDKSIPLGEIDDAGHLMLNLLQHIRADIKKQAFDDIASALERDFPNSGLTYLLEGEFYVEYAWDGRTRKPMAQVTSEQRRLFQERLATAAQILAKGAALDPKEGRIPAVMIQVVSGQEKGFPEMERWFEKAMEVDPNNYTACSYLLNFLQPKWFGSRDVMLQFGRKCVASDKWGGQVPLILADAHYLYNRTYGAPDGSYWKQPDVWPDIQSAFEKFFRLNPNARSWRDAYALYAYWCGQWDVLQQQLNLIGDDVDYSYFGGMTEYQEMLKQLKQHESSSTASTNTPVSAVAK